MMHALKIRVMGASRMRKLEHFYSLCTGGRVLDAGVSARARIEWENFFADTFRFADEAYTGLGVEDLREMRARHPQKRFVTYDGKIFPFASGEFDWVFSNAVVEHVGSDTDQLRFINEMLRVGRNVFFTTPNRYFPVESHTNALLLHWLPERHFHRWCAGHRPMWTPANLRLLSYRRLKTLMERSDATSYRIVKNRFALWPMTFTVICRK